MFVIFLIVNNMILLNIMLSVFYINYKQAMENNINTNAVASDLFMKDAAEYRRSLSVR